MASPAAASGQAPFKQAELDVSKFKQAIFTKLTNLGMQHGDPAAIKHVWKLVNLAAKLASGPDGQDSAQKLVRALFKELGAPQAGVFLKWITRKIKADFAQSIDLPIPAPADAHADAKSKHSGPCCAAQVDLTDDAGETAEPPAHPGDANESIESQSNGGEGALDDAWVELIAQDGSTYYWDRRNNCCAWNLPAGVRAKWVGQKASDGRRTYYWSLGGEKACWVLPQLQEPLHPSKAAAPKNKSSSSSRHEAETPVSLKQQAVPTASDKITAAGALNAESAAESEMETPVLGSLPASAITGAAPMLLPEVGLLKPLVIVPVPPPAHSRQQDLGPFESALQQESCADQCKAPEKKDAEAAMMERLMSSKIEEMTADSSSLRAEVAMLKEQIASLISMRPETWKPSAGTEDCMAPAPPAPCASKTAAKPSIEKAELMDEASSDSEEDSSDSEEETERKDTQQMSASDEESANEDASMFTNSDDELKDDRKKPESDSEEEAKDDRSSPVSDSEDDRSEDWSRRATDSEQERSAMHSDEDESADEHSRNTTDSEDERMHGQVPRAAQSEKEDCKDEEENPEPPLKRHRMPGPIHKDAQVSSTRKPVILIPRPKQAVDANEVAPPARCRQALAEESPAAARIEAVASPARRRQAVNEDTGAQDTRPHCVLDFGPETPIRHTPVSQTPLSKTACESPTPAMSGTRKRAASPNSLSLVASPLRIRQAAATIEATSASKKIHHCVFSFGEMTPSRQTPAASKERLQQSAASYKPEEMKPTSSSDIAAASETCEARSRTPHRSAAGDSGKDGRTILEKFMTEVQHGKPPGQWDTGDVYTKTPLQSEKKHGRDTSRVRSNSRRSRRASRGRA